MSTKDDVDDIRNVGYGNVSVFVDIGIGDDEIVILFFQDVCHHQGYVGDGDGSVAVHVAHKGDGG